MILARAASTNALGTPESGTGTAIHCSFGLTTVFCRSLYSRVPSGPISATLSCVVCRLPNHQMP